MEAYVNLVTSSTLFHVSSEVDNNKTTCKKHFLN
jgi:hypothetical protein